MGSQFGRRANWPAELEASALWGRVTCALIPLLCVLLLFSPQVAAHDDEPMFTQLFNELDVEMLLIEPDSGRIVEANPAAARFYGFSQAELRDMTIQQINTLTPEQVAAERKLAQSEGRNHFIFRHRLADGEIRTVEVHSRRFLFDGRPLLVSLIHDITPGRHEAEQLWYYQQQLEEMVDAQVREIEQVRNRQIWWLLVGLIVQMGLIGWLLFSIVRRRRLEHEREALLADLRARNAELARLGEAMAHHFQEPVRRLASYAQLLETVPELGVDSRSRQAVRFINEQARRLSTLVSEAQAYLTLAHGAGRSSGWSDCASVLRRVMAEIDLTAQQAQVVIHEPLPHVVMDEQSLSDLFAIVLLNAVTYRHPDQMLTVEVSATLAAGYATLRFADNGVGIAPDQREYVFGLYTRLVPNSVPGTGMGLARARKLVELTGGRIHIEDGIDTGVCITIELPASPGPA